MAGRQAKLLTKGQIRALTGFSRNGRYAKRNRVIVLLSLKAGLRACEISGLTWSMVLDPQGRVGEVIELTDAVSKMGGGRLIPIHPDLRRALVELKRNSGVRGGPVVSSERGGPMSPNSLVNWFGNAFKQLGFDGCSSHSGRRTFVTIAARTVHRVGGSLRDVQQLAGHRSIETTQRYIEGDTSTKRRLIRLI